MYFYISKLLLRFIPLYINMEYLRELWNNKGFEIAVGLSLLFLLGYGVYRKLKGVKGSWYRYSIETKKNPVYTHTPRQDSKGEIETRRVLEDIFGVPFAKVRPDFLKNPVTGGNYNLEIDCYNDRLKLGVEYQGQQHYKFNAQWHKTKDAFLNQKYRDDMKRRLCRDNGVTLIEVPYTIPLHGIKTFLINKLEHLGFIH